MFGIEKKVEAANQEQHIIIEDRSNPDLGVTNYTRKRHRDNNPPVEIGMDFGNGVFDYQRRIIMQLAVLLRNCKHAFGATNSTADATSTTYERYALKCDQFSVQLAKTPIQIPVPQQSPEIIDLGIFRPSISIGGIVDNLGQDTSNTTTGFQNMEYIDVTRRYFPDNSNYAEKSNRYYIPYKNALEEVAYKWITSEGSPLEQEIGDANYTRYNRSAEPNSADPVSTTISGTNNETGGGVYIVAIQQARFQVDPATEDRWTFQMQFVAESRKDVLFQKGIVYGSTYNKI